MYLLHFYLKLHLLIYRQWLTKYNMLRALIFNTILNTTLYCNVGSRLHTFQHIVREKNVQK